MADCKKWIHTLLFFIFGVYILLLTWYFNSLNDREVSSARFDWYQPKRFSSNFGIQQENDPETRMQNLSAVKNSGENAFGSSNSNTKECTKQVLYWPGPRMLLPDGEYFCPDVNCAVRFKSERSYRALNTSHAVILHHTGNWNINELKRYRPEGQMWIYMSRESPPYSAHGRVPNVFNWTMTYRQDSDFPISYGVCVDYDFSIAKLNLMKNQNKNWAKSKTKLTAWIASNCNGPSWPRTKFVKELSKKMPVDMFGKCGGKPCPGKECFERLRSYKFYLAFENGRCTDYITEKMWRNSFVFDAVPIVYGTNKQNYEKLAPPNSFIHLSDFPNMTSLANYIKVLDRNDSLYNAFLRWKDFCFIDEKRENEVITQEMLCSITKKLQSVDKMSKNGTIIADLKKIFFDTCDESPPLPLPV